MEGRAFGGNWGAERRRLDNAKKLREAERADEQRVRGLEQRRYVELAQAHRHEHAYFESVAAQLDNGGKLSQRQAAMLLKIAGEQGWSTALAAEAAEPKKAPTVGKGGGSDGVKQGKIERELLDYAGDDPTLTEYAERCRAGEALSNSERGKANWLLRQQGLR